MSTLVSVIIPTRNRRVLLSRTLSTVLAQTHSCLDVIVVDDGSTDGTPQFLATLDDPRVRVLVHPHSLGVARARNHGLEAAKGLFVAFVDDDDLWAPEKTASQLAAIEAQPGACWSFAAAVVVDPKLRLVRWQRAPVSQDLASRLIATNVVPGGGSSVLAAREAIETVGAFDPRFSTFADWDLWIRLAHLGPAAPVEEPLVAYLRHTSMSVDAEPKYRELALLEEKYSSIRATCGAQSCRVPVLHNIAEAALRSGDAREARRAYRYAAKLPQNRLSTLRSLLVGLPGYLAFYDLSKRTAIPRRHRVEAERWLAPVRQQVHTA